MMRYDTYKPSGIDWLGNVPNHWKIIRIKDIIVKIGSGVTPKGGSEVYVSEGIPLLRSQNVYDDGLRIDDVSFIDEATHTKMRSSQLKPNDILINITGASIGRTCIVPYTMPRANINQHIIFIRAKKNLVPYASNYFKTNSVKEYINLIQAGTSKEALNMGQTLNIPIILPSPDEQTAIAQYLDTKTQAIDKKINLLTKKTDYYKELRKSIINEAVCKGLNKKVKLKESGIDWIGKIPEHWKISRVKDSFSLFTGNSISDKEMFERKENSIDYVSTKDIDVDTGRINYDNGVYIPKEDKSFKIAKANSTLICIEGANAGKKIGFTEKEICFVNKLCAIKSRTKNNTDKYFYYFTQSPLFEKQFFAILNGLIGGVSLNSIKYFDIISPTKEEQTAISNYLDEKTQKIDAIVSNIGKQIDTLKELRKTLINDVVTGKIKVTANEN